jgi:hypothetical protein
MQKALAVVEEIARNRGRIGPKRRRGSAWHEKVLVRSPKGNQGPVALVIVVYLNSSRIRQDMSAVAEPAAWGLS